jgi:hypothetical protein
MWWSLLLDVLVLLSFAGIEGICGFLVNSSFILGDIWMSLLEIFFLGGNLSTGMSGAYGTRKLKQET